MDRGMARERERTPHGLGTLVGDARGVERAREPGRRTRAETWVRGSSRTGEARTQSQLVAVLEGRLGILLHGLVVRILAGVVGDDESATNAAGGARRAEGAPRRARVFATPPRDPRREKPDSPGRALFAFATAAPLAALTVNDIVSTRGLIRP